MAEHERDLEVALRELKSAEESEANTEEPSWDDHAIDELIEIGADTGAILEAPTTENRDRKELFQIMIEGVVVESYSRAVAGLRVSWADGTPLTLVEAPLRDAPLLLGIQLEKQGVSLRAIVQALNERGYRTNRGTLWTVHAVYQALKNFRARLRDDPSAA
jgi:hypothetical protein